MDEILQFLTENPTFYLATVEGSVPKVRPFGFVMKYDGKLCFCTNNRKNVYKQMKENPHIEISTTNKDSEWLRLRGKAVFCTSRESKQAALAAAPYLSNLYQIDDGIFEVFFIDEAEATFSNMKGESRTVRL
ncbi:pyridoxamine 5'-phosphate oxidase family protein [Caproiciproducens sp. CPB-2]|uniref:pyridoxamine 5'-phosphate oxidase family protein n=1 Tax=unclassified Caproiciproducens TaxID=2643836 RepID=UPI0023D9E0B6|nr:pyridoxamine 5'-phosphate oxidase family protein [Caproiciproducens sp. CPB-2]MDF1494476.1 pyridoxamine 5'-phosphate oxidase family protein [Caproiciproducens sp. CPB-2]